MVGGWGWVWEVGGLEVISQSMGHALHPHGSNTSGSAFPSPAGAGPPASGVASFFSTITKAVLGQKPRPSGRCAVLSSTVRTSGLGGDVQGPVEAA